VLSSDCQLRPQSAGGAARSFCQVAQTVTLINRFRSCAQRRYIAFGQCFVEPVVRQSAHGNSYWSVLEEENSEFLDRLGYYIKGPRRSVPKPASNTLPVERRSGWASIKAAAVKSPCPVLDVPKMSDKKSPTLSVSAVASGTKSPNLLNPSPRPPNVGLIEDGISEDSSLPIPARFMSRPSICFSPQKLIIRPHAEFGADLQSRIPTIEINNNEPGQVLSRHTDHSGFEWYQSSSFSSSTTTDDVTTPSSTDSYLHRLEEIRSARVASGPDDDCDRLFLRVSSDAASTVSSQTLVEGNGSFETTGAESTTDPSKFAGTHAERIKQRRLPETLRLETEFFDIEEVSRTHTRIHSVSELPQVRLLLVRTVPNSKL